jgi:hypothetical protein
VPAVRQKLHLSSCADFRDRLLHQNGKSSGIKYLEGQLRARRLGHNRRARTNIGETLDKCPHWPDILSPDNCFQTIRYGWPQRVPISVLTDFFNFHILDTRFCPNINSATSRRVKSWHISEFTDGDKFSEIYWLLSREAVSEDSIDRYAA